MIYEVNLAVDDVIADACAAWVQPHIDEVLTLPGFLGADGLTPFGGRFTASRHILRPGP